MLFFLNIKPNFILFALQIDFLMVENIHPFTNPLCHLYALRTTNRKEQAALCRTPGPSQNKQQVKACLDWARHGQITKWEMS